MRNKLPINARIKGSSLFSLTINFILPQLTEASQDDRKKMTELDLVR